MGKKLIAAWVCLGLLFIVAGYLFTYQEHIRLNLNRIALTQEVLTKIYDLQNNLNEAEAGVREYVASGEEIHQAYYRKAVQEISLILTELRQLILGDKEQERLSADLERQIKQRLELLDKTVALRQEKGAEDPKFVDLKKNGTRIQGGIRQTLDKMEEAEKKQLDPQWAQGKAKRRSYRILLTLGAAVSFILVLVIFYLMNQEILQRKKAEESLARYQEDLRTLASQLSLAEERERRRLALQLHDQIGHTLALTRIRLGEIKEEAASREDLVLQQRLQETSLLVEQAIQDTQSLIFRISPPILYELGLEPALEWLAEHISTQHHLQVRFEKGQRAIPVEQNLEILLFQAVNELLFNVVKHARAQQVNVSLWEEGNVLKVGVDDDGLGIMPDMLHNHRQHNGGFGLFSIRERLKPFNGRLEVHSQPDEGTQITISIPLNYPHDQN